MSINSSNGITNSFRSNSQINQASERIASGRRINSAADDAAGLAISERMTAIERGINQGTQNAQDMGNLLRTAEGGLSSINDSLVRIRELSIQASNGTLTQQDRGRIQAEVDQHLQNIQSAASGTQFNTMQLLDGSFADRNLASNPDGTGMQINIANTTLATIGLEGFSVMDGNPDLAALDNAMNMINDSRSNIGATVNRIDNIVEYNTNASLNLATANSRIADADIALEVMRLEQERIVQQYQLFSAREQMDRDRREGAGFIGI